MYILYESEQHKIISKKRRNNNSIHSFGGIVTLSESISNKQTRFPSLMYCRKGKSCHDTANKT